MAAVFDLIPVLIIIIAHVPNAPLILINPILPITQLFIYSFVLSLLCYYYYYYYYYYK